MDNKKMKHIAFVLLKPVVSEKTAALSERGCYVFSVCRDATKYSVKQCVEEAFSVVVAKVNVINQDGKVKRQGKRKAVKKALVYLEDGHSIDLTKGVE